MIRIFSAVLLAAALFRFTDTRAEEIVKTGYNLGPLPAIAYDADKGFQFGAILNIYNYGDGSNYPNYDSKIYLEASFFTKGSQLYTFMYDNKTLIPGIRWSSAVDVSIDKALDFYGFNGYTSWYDQERVALGQDNKKLYQDSDLYIYTPYYRVARTHVLAKSDFIGNITEHLSWEAGYHFHYFKEGPINRTSINKGKDDYNVYPDEMTTLFEDYLNWGLISEDEAYGGIISSLRLGIVYDTRDQEGSPSRGIWAEGHIIAAPGWLGTTNPFYRYALTFRQYFPLIKNNVLTLAYRLNYEGAFGNWSPYYAVPFISVMGENCDKDGMGGYRTVRGIMLNRVVGLDMATYTAELRWRFVRFNLWKQNMAFALSCFSDGTMVTRGRDMSFKGEEEYRASYEEYMAAGSGKDYPHITLGSGLRFIMNENFIVAFEYGVPLTHLYSSSHPRYNQDGNGAFYINIGWLF